MAIAEILLRGGIVILSIGGIWLVVKAFRVSALWGFLCCLVPGAQIFFIGSHWKTAKTQFYIMTAGLVLILWGGVVGYYQNSSTFGKMLQNIRVMEDGQLSLQLGPPGGESSSARPQYSQRGEISLEIFDDQRDEAGHNQQKPGEGTFSQFLKEILEKVNWKKNSQRGSTQSEFDRELMTAVLNGDAERVRHFVDLGVDVNLRIGNGETLLMTAAALGYEEMTGVLISAGADVQEKSPEGETALSLARKNYRTDIVEMLENRVES